MSFDLAVFDPSEVPADRKSFLAWWREVVKWEDEGHDYNNPELTTPALRAWFLDIITEFPAMNGPYAKPELPDDEATLTDYTIAKAAIYAGFAWSKAEAAGDAVIKYTLKHGLGLYHVSSRAGEVFLKGADGELFIAHSNETNGPVA